MFGRFKSRRIFASHLINGSFSTYKMNDDLVAQLVEHLTFNQGVLGSNPNRITTFLQNEAFPYKWKGFFMQN
ncbi:MAG: hypothetical protein RL757_2632 [Bacteroidota bacterium]